jgi:hypothetical protein
MAIIRELVGSPNDKYAELIKNLRSLRVIMLKKLGTAAEEEKRSKNILKELKLKIEENEVRLKKQEETFETLKQ